MKPADLVKWIAGIVGSLVLMLFGWVLNDIKKTTDLYKEDRQTILSGITTTSTSYSDLEKRVRELEIENAAKGRRRGRR